MNENHDLVTNSCGDGCEPDVNKQQVETPASVVEESLPESPVSNVSEEETGANTTDSVPSLETASNGTVDVQDVVDEASLSQSEPVLEVQNQHPSSQAHLDLHLSVCPYCGGKWIKSANMDGYERWVCQSCSHETFVENEHSLPRLYALSAFQSKVINRLHEKGKGNKKMRISHWKAHESELNDYIEQCGGTSNQDPLFAIARAAHMTDGFERYLNKDEKIVVEELYGIAKDYLKRHPKAVNVKELVRIYQRKLRNKARRAFWSVFGCLLAIAAAAFVGLYLYAPMPADASSGITVSIPNDAIGLFDKFSVNVDVEE